eukprot:747612-Hanusia_phi.AAC.4
MRTRPRRPGGAATRSESGKRTPSEVASAQASEDSDLEQDAKKVRRNQDANLEKSSRVSSSLLLEGTSKNGSKQERMETTVSSRLIGSTCGSIHWLAGRTTRAMTRDSRNVCSNRKQDPSTAKAEQQIQSADRESSESEISNIDVSCKKKLSESHRSDGKMACRPLVIAPPVRNGKRRRRPDEEDFEYEVSSSQSQGSVVVVCLCPRSLSCVRQNVLQDLSTIQAQDPTFPKGKRHDGRKSRKAARQNKCEILVVRVASDQLEGFARMREQMLRARRLHQHQAKAQKTKRHPIPTQKTNCGVRHARERLLHRRPLHHTKTPQDIVEMLPRTRKKVKVVWRISKEKGASGSESTTKDGYSMAINSLLDSTMNGSETSAQTAAKQSDANYRMLVGPKTNESKAHSHSQFSTRQDDLVHYWFGEAKSRQSGSIPVKSALTSQVNMQAQVAQGHKQDHDRHPIVSNSGLESKYLKKGNLTSKASSSPTSKKHLSSSVVQGNNHHMPSNGSQTSKVQVSMLNNSAPPTSVSFSSTNNSTKYFVGSIIQVQAFKDGNWRTVRIEASRVRSGMEEVRVSYLGGALGLPPEWIPTSSGLLRPIPTTPKQSAWNSSNSKHVAKSVVASSQALQSAKLSIANTSPGSSGYSIPSNGFRKLSLPGAPVLSVQADDSWKDSNPSRLWGAAAALRGATAGGKQGDAAKNYAMSNGMSNGMSVLSLPSNLSALIGNSAQSHRDFSSANMFGSNLMSLSSAMAGTGHGSSQSGGLFSFLSSVEDKESASQREHLGVSFHPDGWSGAMARVALIDAMLPSPFSSPATSTQVQGSLALLQQQQQQQQQPSLGLSGVKLKDASQLR